MHSQTRTPKSKLKILNAGQNYRITGGSDRGQLALESVLRRHGHEVIPFATTHPKNYPTQWSDYFPERVNFEQPTPKDIINFIYSRPAANAIAKLIETIPIDIAHLHIYYGQLTSSILAPLKQRKIPIIQTLHEYKIVCPVYTLISNNENCQDCQGHRFWKATRKRCNRGSLARSFLSTVESYLSRALGSVDLVDHFITLSHFQREKIIELGIPAKKVTAIHNFVDTAGIEPNHQPGRYFLYFGRLERLKGLFTLIEAASTLTDTPLLIVGDGSIRSDLETLIQEKELHHIQLLKFCEGDTLKQLIYNSICSILPSQWYETLGMTLLESFCYGRPVIASAMGGMTEIVRDGVDGYVVPPDNVEELREKMISMAENPQKAVNMGLAGRKKLESQFNSDIYYQKLMEVYVQVL